VKKFFVFIVVFGSFLVLNAQKINNDRLVESVKAFHTALVNKNTMYINQVTDKALSYGHSNGWLETKADMIKNVETNYIAYSSFGEDSIVVSGNGGLANVRFNASITATMNGASNTYALHVLEVWIKKGSRWLLFARQAVKK
jgi:Domain of unknown function (DUF4440)